MELLGVRWRRRTDLETSRGESKRRQHRKTEREEGGWSRRQRGEERITPGHTVWEYTNAHFFFFFFFFFIFCPSSVRFLCHVQHLIWRMWRHFPGKEHVSHCLMHTCACVHSSRIIIKSCGVCVCVFVWVTVRGVGVWIGSGGRLDLALRLMSLLCFCNEVCHENSVCACTRASTHVSAFSASLVWNHRGLYTAARGRRAWMSCHFWGQRSQENERVISCA